MHTREKFALTAVALALSLGVAMPAQAAATMCSNDHMAAADTMAGDSMANDNMAAGDAMASHDDMAMANDSMKDDSMAAGDAMAGHDNMATADESMKDESMSGGTMTADYTVKPGDSLWSIAATTLCDGNRFREIVDANADMLGGGMMIHPGQVLHIPGD